MTDEQTNETDTEGEKTNSTEEKPLSIVEEARAIRDEIIKERETLSNERKSLEKLQSESLLSGTAGGRVEPVVTEETPKEYMNRVMSGGLNEKGTDN